MSAPNFEVPLKLKGKTYMPTTIPGPAYTIRTQRLVVRCWDPADAPLLKEAIDASLDHLRPWMPWALGEPEELQAKIDHIRRFRGKFDLGHDFAYGIFNQEETRVLGGAGLHPRLGAGALEIGYWIHADFTHQGLATEVSTALTKVAFEIEQVKRVEIHCDPQNEFSAAVPKKLGYTCEATLRRRFPISENQYRDTMIWTLFADEYPQSLSTRAEIQAFDAIGRVIL